MKKLGLLSIMMGIKNILQAQVIPVFLTNPTASNKNIDAKPKTKMNNIIKKQNNSKFPEMIFIKGGDFIMGNNSNTKIMSEGKPEHNVKLSDFYIGKYEITFTQYDYYCAETGTKKPEAEGSARGNRAVINVTWNDAVKYCKWLSVKTGKPFRLPTEAEWEYAAKGGFAYPYSGSNKLDEVAWYANNAEQTHNVGEKKANGYGLYDMSGNASEFCLDWFDNDYYSISEIFNPIGPKTGTCKVVRGRSFTDEFECGMTARGCCPQDFRYDRNGFRVALQE